MPMKGAATNSSFIVLLFWWIDAADYIYWKALQKSSIMYPSLKDKEFPYGKIPIIRNKIKSRQALD